MALQQTRAFNRTRPILDAAPQVFSRRGYRDASVDESAGASGTSKGEVDFHFRNEEAIFLALLDKTAGRLREKIESALAGRPERLEDTYATLRPFLMHSVGASDQHRRSDRR